MASVSFRYDVATQRVDLGWEWRHGRNNTPQLYGRINMMRDIFIPNAQSVAAPDVNPQILTGFARVQGNLWIAHELVSIFTKENREDEKWKSQVLERVFRRQMSELQRTHGVFSEWGTYSLPRRMGRNLASSLELLRILEGRVSREIFEEEESRLEEIDASRESVFPRFPAVQQSARFSPDPLNEAKTDSEDSD